MQALKTWQPNPFPPRKTLNNIACYSPLLCYDLVHQEKLPLKKKITRKKKKPASQSKKKAHDLLTQVIRLTGIPSRIVRRDLGVILKRKNLDPKTMSLADIRTVVACYLREIMSGILDQQHH